MQLTLPLKKDLSKETMYAALMDKDAAFEGLFYTCVKTTGIFCRPTCPARKPKKENCVFVESVKEALLRGYRPCRVCKPLERAGNAPEWMADLLKELENSPTVKIKDMDLRKRGLHPNRVRRWFQKEFGLTFQGYQRALRLGEAFGHLREGSKVIDTAFENGYGSLSGFTDAFKKKMGVSPKQSKSKQVIIITRLLSPLGSMIAGVADEGVCLLEFADRRMLETQLGRLEKFFNARLLPGTHPLFGQLMKELNEYFEGQRRQFTVPLALRGTEFQQKVWSILQEIPYGKVRSYKQQAERLGNLKTIRAVAGANGDNRIAIIIPCHRVIGADGQLVGYGGGLWRKRYLLDLERKVLAGEH